MDQPPRETPSRGAALFDVVAFFILLFAASFLAQAFLVQGLGLRELWTAIPVAAFVFAGMMWLMAHRGLRFADIGLRRPDSRRRTLLAAVAILAVVMLVVGVLLPQIAERTGERPDLSRLSGLLDSFTGYMMVLVVIWTTAAFAEEVFFRGFLMQRLAVVFGGRTPAWGAAAVVQAVLFGAMHAYQGLAGIVVTGMIGVVFGFAFLLVGRNLWPLMLAHGAFDTATVTQLYLAGQ